MISTLIQTIESIFIHFSFKRLLYIIFLFSVIILSLYVFELKTGYALYNRLEHRVDLLERLHRLQKDSVDNNEELYRIYQSVIKEMESTNEISLGIELLNEPFIKFFSAALIPFIFMVTGAVQMINGKPESSSLFGGAVFVTLLFGVPAIYIPTLSSVWINAGIYSLIQAVLMFILVIYGHAVKNKQ